MTKIGRNDPCTCGSGKKYKHCCERGTVLAFPNSPASMMALGDDQRRVKALGRPEFLGLSPDDIEMILDSHIQDCDKLIEFDWTAVDRYPKASPLLTGCQWLLLKLQEGPIRLTKAGYLPPTVVAAWWNEAVKDSTDDFFNRQNSVQKMSDSPLLERLMTIIVGLDLLEYSDKYVLPGKYFDEYLACENHERYAYLYQGLVEMLGWEDALRYRYTMLPSATQQDGWLFGMFILEQAKDSWFESGQLADTWLQAFPVDAEDFTFQDQPMEPQMLPSVLQEYVRAISIYNFDLLPSLLGLVESRYAGAPGYEHMLRLSPLGQELHRWRKSPVPQQRPGATKALQDLPLKPIFVWQDTKPQPTAATPWLEGSMGQIFWDGLINEARSRGRSLHQLMSELRGTFATLSAAPDYPWIQARWVEQELSRPADPHGTMFLATQLLKLIKKVLRNYGPRFFDEASTTRDQLLSLFERSLCCPSEPAAVGAISMELRAIEKDLDKK